MKHKIKGILKFLGSVFLYALAWLLFPIISLLNFMILLFKGKARGYFLNSAVNLDRFANYEFRTLFNLVLRKKEGVKFGNFEETISSVLGKNQRDKTLSGAGKILAGMLDFIDKDHCRKSIKEI